MSAETWEGNSRVLLSVASMVRATRTVLSNRGEEDATPPLAASTRRRAATYFAFLLLYSVSARTLSALGIYLAAKFLTELPRKSWTVPLMSWKTGAEVRSVEGLSGSRSSIVV